MFEDINFVTNIDVLPIDEKVEIAKVVEHFPFLSTTYYLSLIRFDDPYDPIRRIVIPDPGELEPWGRADPSNEADYTVMEGVQHKYASTLLVLASDRCAGLCRYCFRKRLFLKDQYAKPEKLQDLDELVKYIEAHREITNVLISGGDAFMLPTRKLEEIIRKISQIDHIKSLRLGTRILSYWPQRISEDEKLLEILDRYSRPHKRIYVVTHFDHPREITPQALKAIDLLIKAGVVLLNQCPLIKGVNDDPDILASLFLKLVSVGIAPYYVFQCRPTIGNRPFAVPVEEGYKIVEEAKSRCCGVAKRARFVMSHARGKLEIVALTKEHVFFKFHRAARREDKDKLLVFERNLNAFWLDDYTNLVTNYNLEFN